MRSPVLRLIFETVSTQEASQRFEFHSKKWKEAEARLKEVLRVVKGLEEELPEVK